jgi:hypothetical protein
MCFRFKSASSGFFNYKGPQLQQHADRLLKDNFVPDLDLLLCCAVVKTLYVKGEIYLGSLHLFPGKSFHRTTSFPWAGSGTRSTKILLTFINSLLKI